MIKKPYIVVVVDDDPGIIELLTDACEDNFSKEILKVQSFTDPIKALDFVKVSYCNILILDMNMKGQYGDILVNDFKSARPALKISIFSAESKSLNRMSCYLNGADNYIEKPFKEDHFIEVLQGMIKNLNHWESILYPKRKDK